MKSKRFSRSSTLLTTAIAAMCLAGSSLAADKTHPTSDAGQLAGSVQAAGKPVAGADVTLYAAGTGAPAKLAEAKTDAQGALKRSRRVAEDRG